MSIPSTVNGENLQPAANLSATTSGDGCGTLDGEELAADAEQSQLARREFVFPGDLASVPASREQIMQFVGEHCQNEGDQIDILVALQEALANAALHGCGDDPSQKIQCRVAANTSDVMIAVRDPGSGFDLTLADPDRYAASTLTHGRGICLMRSLMTDVSFAHGGAEIRLHKRIGGN